MSYMDKFKAYPKGGIPYTNKGLELVSLNAGQGAFHWVRDVSSQCSGGWFFDCGTLNSQKELRTSIKAIHGTGITSPEMVIVSHYHKDHISNLDDILLFLITRAYDDDNMEDESDTLLAGQQKPALVWLPRIDPFSMSLYLRLLAFISLFKYSNYAVPIKEAIRLFSKTNHLAFEIAKMYPELENRIHFAASGDVQKYHYGHKMISVKAVSPPNFPRNQSHPLAPAAATIAYILSDSETRNSIYNLMQNISETALRGDVGFQRFLQRAWGPDPGISFIELPMVAANIIRRGIQEGDNSTDDDYEYENRMLHMWLALSSYTPEKMVPRLKLSGKNSPISGPLRNAAQALPEIIHQAAHLFNLAVEISDGESSYLLTGDAAVQLWPEILRRCQKRQTAVQVAHHGSENNVLFESFTKINSDVYVVSAGKYKKWRHPSIKLGVAISRGQRGENAALYCTNVHNNCELKKRGASCRSCIPKELSEVTNWPINKNEKNNNIVIDEDTTIRAISVTPSKVEWIIDSERYCAEKCPEV